MTKGFLNFAVSDTNLEHLKLSKAREDKARISISQNNEKDDDDHDGIVDNSTAREIKGLRTHLRTGSAAAGVPGNITVRQAGPSQFDLGRLRVPLVRPIAQGLSPRPRVGSRGPRGP